MEFQNEERLSIKQKMMIVVEIHTNSCSILSSEILVVKLGALSSALPQTCGVHRKPSLMQMSWNRVYRGQTLLGWSV